MPFVLQHKQTNQIYTCLLANHYQLAYYGVKFWLSNEEAETDYKSFLQEKELESSVNWQVIEMDEGLMKLGNVKLKNDLNLELYWGNEGQRPEVRKG